MSSTLQVNDPRSRGRSKSPSGRPRDRDRSRSRDSRIPSPSPAPSTRNRIVVRGPRDGSDDEGLRDVARGARRRERHGYDLMDSDEEERRRRYRDGGGRGEKYYFSDSEEDERARYTGRAGKGYYYPDDDSDESLDEGLAYGDPGLPRRGHSRVSSKLDAPSSSRHERKRSSSRLGDERIPVSAPGSHPSYAAPRYYQYADPAHYAPGTTNLAGYTGAPTTVPRPNWAPVPECEMPGFVPPQSRAERQAMPGAFPPPDMQHMNMSQFAPTTRPLSIPTSHVYAPSMGAAHQRTSSSDAVPPIYANPAPFQYAQVDPSVKYGSKGTTLPYAYSATPQFSKPVSMPPSSEPHYVEITPGKRAARPNNLSVSTSNLTAGGPDGRPPASPLLEPYKGTYQSISPMPSPIMSGDRMDDDISDLEPLDGASESDRRKKSKRRSNGEKEKKSERSKRDRSSTRHERHESRGSGRESVMLISPSTSRKQVKFYDPVPDAIAMRDALSHTRHIDTKTLTQILPHLPSEDILALRKEYKNHVKLHGKGINMAKHIRLKLGNSAFGKVCYATALGRWESEAYWANCYYQSSTSRRELLIESLIGRSNSEIAYIKDSFRDSRYADSLEKCMKSELKADKFRTAVLLALEEPRQSERGPIDPHLVRDDVEDLHRALVSRDGGETAMIYIIVLRSDSHLREVLRAYEKVHKRNFARAMITKSQNLVGETLAHILNGVINRPMRDALLLHQALHESRTGKERSELLISRLVRLHWEPKHLEQVKHDFRKRYGERLEEAIAEEVLPSSGGSEWGEFCIELARTGSKVD